MHLSGSISGCPMQSLKWTRSDTWPSLVAKTKKGQTKKGQRQLGLSGGIHVLEPHSITFERPVDKLLAFPENLPDSKSDIAYEAVDGHIAGIFISGREFKKHERGDARKGNVHVNQETGGANSPVLV